MSLTIKPAKRSDLEEYTDLLQKTYQKAYTNDELGLTKDCFSKKVFNTKNTQDYLKSNLISNKKQKAWLVFLETKMVGAITIIDKGNEIDIRGFYVSPENQGQSIGKALFRKALEFSKGKDIVVETYVHNLKTIEIYKKWGFKIDIEKGFNFRHWPEWPKGLQAKLLFMRLIQKT